jgi:hypothetical protein
MPWNEADRAKYDVIRESYSSDLSDGQFPLILCAASRAQGRKPTCAPEFSNALIYLIRSDCPDGCCPRTFLRSRRRRIGSTLGATAG